MDPCPRSDGILIRRARVLGATPATRARARLSLEAVLADLSIPSGQGSGRALLMIRRLAPARALRIRDARSDSAYSAAVTRGIEASYRLAARPWLQPGSANREALQFADAAELAACLIRDELRDTGTRHWWRSMLLEDATFEEWSRRHLLHRGDLLVPVLAMLAAQGWAARWLERLGRADLERAGAAVAEAYGLGSASEQSGRPAADAPDLFPGPTTPAVNRARLLALVPEVRAVQWSPPGRRLIATALALRRDPLWVRSLAFEQALRWLESTPQRGADPRPQACIFAATAVRVSAVFEPLSALTSGGGSSAPQPDQRQSDGKDPNLRGAHGKNATGVTEHPAQAQGAEHAGWSIIAAVGPVCDHPWDRSIQDGPLPAPLATAPSASGRAPTVEQGDATPQVLTRQARKEMSDRRAGASPLDAPRPDLSRSAATTTVADNTGPDEIPVGQDSARIPSPTFGGMAGGIMGEPRPQSNESISLGTDCGGLFYLINVALSLGLYGDFTQPRRPGIALSPWDWLALVGERWLGRDLRADPLWALFGQLAVRPDGQPPGTGFAPPDAWLMPEDWPAPWGAVPVRIEVHRGRLRLHHPAGFLLADAPRRAAVSPRVQARGLLARWPPLTLDGGPRMTWPVARGRQPGWQPRPSPLDRWLGWLLPYLEARLALALGSDDPTTVPLLVCRHRARVEVSATALDVHLSLAELPMAIRIAGLDRDPGWIPAAGRTLAFHFR